MIAGQGLRSVCGAFYSRCLAPLFVYEAIALSWLISLWFTGPGLDFASTREFSEQPVLEHRSFLGRFGVETL